MHWSNLMPDLKPKQPQPEVTAPQRVTAWAALVASVVTALIGAATFFH
jgi:hypothetical protein